MSNTKDLNPRDLQLIQHCIYRSLYFCESTIRNSATTVGKEGNSDLMMQYASEATTLRGLAERLGCFEPLMDEIIYGINHSDPMESTKRLKRLVKKYDK